MASSNKDMRKLIRSLERQDWRVKEGKHIMLFPPDSHSIVTVSKSPASGSLSKVIKQCRDAGAIL